MQQIEAAGLNVTSTQTGLASHPLALGADMLEQSIQELTIAVKELSALLRNQTPKPQAQPAKPIKVAKAANDEAAEQPKPTSLSLDDVRRVLGKVPREAALALLSSFEAKRLSDVPQDKYGQLIEAAQQTH